MMQTRNKFFIFLILTALVLGGTIFAIRQSQTAEEAPNSNVAPPNPPPAHDTVIAPEQEVYAQYAGSSTCKECHESAYKGWTSSNHGLAERNYRKDMDESAFSPKQTFEHGGHSSETFLDAAGVATILTQGLDGKRHNFPVVRIIGNDPLRQFLVPAPGTASQTCDVSYDPH